MGLLAWARRRLGLARPDQGAEVLATRQQRRAAALAEADRQLRALGCADREVRRRLSRAIAGRVR